MRIVFIGTLCLFLAMASNFRRGSKGNSPIIKRNSKGDSPNTRSRGGKSPQPKARAPDVPPPEQQQGSPRFLSLRPHRKASKALNYQYAALKNDDIIQKRSPVSEYNIQELVAAGQCGSVFRATCTKDESRVVAIKVIHKIYNPRVKKQAVREVRMLSFLNRHDNIVKMEAAFKFDGTMHIVMEYLPGGSLERFSKTNGSMGVAELPTHFLIRILADILRALNYLHLFNIIHRDIKPGNVLIGPEGAKITDFNMSTEPLANPGLHKTRYGTLPFVAPECLAEVAQYGVPVDIWSFGMLVASVWCNPSPGCTPETFLYEFMANQSPWFNIDELVPEAKSIYFGCAAWSPENRKTASELLTDPFFGQAFSSDEYRKHYNGLFMPL